MRPKRVLACVASVWAFASAAHAENWVKLGIPETPDAAYAVDGDSVSHRADGLTYFRFRADEKGVTHMIDMATDCDVTFNGGGANEINVRTPDANSVFMERRALVTSPEGFATQYVCDNYK